MECYTKRPPIRFGIAIDRFTAPHRADVVRFCKGDADAEHVQVLRRSSALNS
jgi:hypothetical protein